MSLCSWIRKYATERLPTIIGEAANQLDPGTREAIDQALGARSSGYAAYDSLSPPTLHRIATGSLPSLWSVVVGFLG